MSRRRALVTQAGLLLIAGLLLWLALRGVSWSEVLDILRMIDPRELVAIVLLDLGILFCISARWWVLLRGFDQRVPYLSIVRYRTTVFGLSYITPGPQVGGEVLQVYYPSQLHQVPIPVSLAAASVDKTMEWVGNFTFIVIGGFVVLIGQRMISEADALALGLISLLLLIPLAVIVQIWRGRHPISGFLEWIERILPHRHRAQLRETPVFRSLPRLARLKRTLYHSEDITASLWRTRPWTLVAALVFTLMTWAFILSNFWLMTQALGLPLSPAQAAGALVLVYFAFLLPVPGGLGAMEAALVLAFTSFGYTATQALSLGLLMRARDIAQAVIGLLVGGVFWNRRPELPPEATERAIDG
jgi:uncharacterized protein (TIRG00374 family)